MKKNELISSIERGKALEKLLKYDKINERMYFVKRSVFDNFLSRLLNISMFVPAELVDNEWIVLEEPKHIYSDSPNKEDSKMYKSVLKQYKTALDNVIFEGFEVTKSKHKGITIKDKNNNVLAFYNDYVSCQGNAIMSGNIKIIQGLTKIKPTLTARGIKDSGIN